MAAGGRRRGQRAGQARRWRAADREGTPRAKIRMTNDSERIFQVTSPSPLRMAKSASKLDALHTLRAKSGLTTSRQRMECVQLAGALEMRGSWSGDSHAPNHG